MRRLAAVLVLIATAASAFAQEAGRDLFDWRELPPLPQRVIEMSAGTHNGALLLAGGHNAPSVINPNVYVLVSGTQEWKSFPWTEPRVFGVGVSTPRGVAIVGGRTVSDPSPKVTLLRWSGQSLEIEALPDLPAPLIGVSGAAVGNTVYIVGAESGGAARVQALDLAVPAPRWEDLPPPPEPMRTVPVFASLGSSLYLFGGAGSGGTAVLDGYRYTPGKGWNPVAAPPVPMSSAPALAFGESQAHVLVFGTGVPRRIWAYHTVTDTWAPYGKTPDGFGEGTVVPWDNGVAVIGPLYISGMLGVPKARPDALFALDYIFVAVYLLAMVGIGVYFSRAEKSTGHFFLGGRRVPWWAVGLSIFGTAVSSITYLAVPAKAFGSDWVFLLTATGTLLLAPITVRYYLPHFRKWPITTAYEYLEKRFNFATRLYGSLVFLVFQTGRVGTVLFLPSLSLSAATGIDIYACILLMGVLSTIYTVMGGIEAVIWTDVVQSIILIGGALLVLVFVVLSIPGGFGAMAAEAWSTGKLHTFEWSWDATIASVWVIVLGNFFAVAYPMTADQTVVQRYLTTADEKQAARAIWTNALLSIPTTALFLGIGTALWVFYHHRPDLLDPTLKPDGILPLFVAQQLPRGMSGVILAAVFAAAMSTLSSSINSVASVLVNDYYRRFRPDISERRAFSAARWTSAVFGVFGTAIALLLATWPVESLLDVFYEFLNLVGGGLAGVMALGVLTRRANGPGALIGAAASALAVWYATTYTPLHFFLYAAVGLFTAFIVGYLASLPFRTPNQPT